MKCIVSLSLNEESFQILEKVRFLVSFCLLEMSIRPQFLPFALIAYFAEFDTF